MSTKRVIPKFNSEAEEADWWYENREWVEEQFEEAAETGVACAYRRAIDGTVEAIEGDTRDNNITHGG